MSLLRSSISGSLSHFLFAIADPSQLLLSLYRPCWAAAAWTLPSVTCRAAASQHSSMVRHHLRRHIRHIMKVAFGEILHRLKKKKKVKTHCKKVHDIDLKFRLKCNSRNLAVYRRNEQVCSEKCFYNFNNNNNNNKNAENVEVRYK